MTDAELKKLKRNELLQMLIEQSKTVEELKAELQEKDRLLAERSIAISEAGSIANAALKLNGVFEAAQAAAEQYLESVKAQCKGGSITYVRNDDKSSDNEGSDNEGGSNEGSDNMSDDDNSDSSVSSDNNNSDNKHDDGNKINQRLRRMKKTNRNR